jgi:ribosomal protein S18 acetylase RimI-like enzyme
LGRMLLRYGVSSAHSAGFSKAVLSVNAENETALRLYRSEGFLTVETVVCYSLTCDPRQTTSRSA